MRDCWRQFVLPIVVLLGLACPAPSQTYSGTAEPAPNPYNAQLTSLQQQWTRVQAAPEAALLLRRICGLRDYVDDPAAVTRWMERAAAESTRPPLLRDNSHIRLRQRRGPGVRI